MTNDELIARAEAALEGVTEAARAALKGGAE